MRLFVQYKGGNKSNMTKAITPKIREIQEKELPVLKDLLYEAIYQPDKENSIPKKMIDLS